MSQHDYDVANGSGSSVRADLNSLAGAIQSQNSGSNAPTATTAGMVWYDTTNQAMKQRNSANSAWQSQAESIAGGHLAGHRNRIINGAMKIDQRRAGASQTFTAAAALAYSVDRWYGYCTGANITGARITSGAENRYRFTGATSNTGVGFGQRIEAANSMDLAGRTCTLSAKLSSSSLTSITWTAYYANSADTFGTLASPTRTQIATGSFSISSTEATYSAQINVSASATTGIEIVFTGGALLGSQTLTIGDVQFEPGGVATPFEMRMISTELSLCQRYYEKSYADNVVPGTNSTDGYASFGTCDTASNLYFNSTVRFTVPKRATPSTSFWDLAGGFSRTTQYTGGGLVRTDDVNNLYSVSNSTTTINVIGLINASTFAVYHWAATSEL
jgi:hypothetical protein